MDQITVVVEQVKLSSVYVQPQGLPGISTNPKLLLRDEVYIFSDELDEWIINHNFNTKLFSIKIIDFDNQIHEAPVSIIDNNQFKINFLEKIKGMCYVSFSSIRTSQKI